MYNALYDSVVQKRHFQLIDGFARKSTQVERLCRTALVGQMRLDLIFSGDIVLTYPQVLDGSLFLHADPARVLDEIAVQEGVPAPIRVMSQTGRLLDDAARLAVNTDGSYKPFEFSSMPAGARKAMRDRLDHLSSHGTRGELTWEHVIKVAEKAGVSPRARQRLVAGWHAWARSAISVNPSGPQAGSEMYERAIARAKDLKHDLVAFGGDEPAGDVFEGILRRLETDLTVLEDGAKRPTRTDLYKVIDRMTTSDETLRAESRDWLDTVFNLTFGEQHGCEDFQQARRHSFRPVRPTDAGSRVSAEFAADLEFCSIDVPSDFMLRLGVLNSASWRGWVKAHDAGLAIWRNELDGRAREIRKAFEDLNGRLADVRLDEIQDHLGGVPSYEVPKPFRLHQFVGYAGMVGVPLAEEAVIDATSRVTGISNFMLLLAFGLAAAGAQMAESFVSNASLASDIGGSRQGILGRDN